MKPTSNLVVGVDVGGSFTDLFVLDEAEGTARIVKVPSTPLCTLKYSRISSGKGLLSAFSNFERSASVAGGLKISE